MVLPEPGAWELGAAVREVQTLILREEMSCRDLRGSTVPAVNTVVSRTERSSGRVDLMLRVLTALEQW